LQEQSYYNYELKVWYCKLSFVVRSGGSSQIMAMVVIKINNTKRVHVCD